MWSSPWALLIKSEYAEEVICFSSEESATGIRHILNNLQILNKFQLLNT